MNKQYVHVMIDPAVDEPEGQAICNHCKLESAPYTEAWEDFLNGWWTQEPPIMPGYYPVKLTEALLDAIDEFCPTEGGWVDWNELVISFRWNIPFPVGSLPTLGMPKVNHE